MFSHFDYFTGMDNRQAVTFFRVILLQHPPYFLFISDEYYIVFIFAYGVNCSQNDFFWRIIPAHSVYSYFHYSISVIPKTLR